MVKKRRILWLAVAMLCFLSQCLAACSATGGHIEDSNGESKELAVITDSDIQNGTYGSVCSMSSSSSRGYNTSGVIGGHKEEDNDYSSLTVKKFSGIQIANAYMGNGADVTYTVESTVSSGNFKIVVMNEEHEILYVVPIDEKATVTVPTEAGKLYFVIYAGESAEIKVELWRTVA